MKSKEKTGYLVVEVELHPEEGYVVSCKSDFVYHKYMSDAVCHGVRTLNRYNTTVVRVVNGKLVGVYPGGFNVTKEDNSIMAQELGLS